MICTIELSHLMLTVEEHNLQIKNTETQNIFHDRPETGTNWGLGKIGLFQI